MDCRVIVHLPIADPDYKQAKSDIRMWLHARGLDYDLLGVTLSDDDRHYLAHYVLYDRDAAVLFKLTWGGA